MSYASLPLVNGPFCEGCCQRPFGERYVESDGLGTSGIMLVGEGPWQDEVREGKPFAGAAGAFLDRCLRRLGIQRQQLFITNSTFCKARRLGWFDHPDADAAAAFEHCRPHLDRLIEKVKPKVIVALGNTALQRLLGVRGIEQRHAYVQPSPYGIPVIATWHPSAIMQGNQKLTGPFMFALRRAQEIAAGSWKRTSPYYVLDDFSATLGYLKDAHDLLVVDTETPKSSKLDEETVDEEDESYTIIRASLSHTIGTACSFPWIEPFITMARDTISKAKVVVMHNAGFDRPRLEAQEFSFRGVHDSMWAWHFLQSDLPKGLGFVAPFYYDGEPWKHLAEMQPAFYSAVDADATLRVYLGVKADLERQGRWERWLRHCVQAMPILSRMGRRGILIDLDEQAKLRDRLQVEYDAAYLKLQEEVPVEVRPIKRWKRKHEGATEFQVPCGCNLEGVEV